MCVFFAFTLSILIRLENILCLSKEKNYYLSILTTLLMFLEKNLTQFLGVHCTTEEEHSNQNGVVVDRGERARIFDYFGSVMNKGLPTLKPCTSQNKFQWLLSHISFQKKYNSLGFDILFDNSQIQKANSSFVTDFLFFLFYSFLTYMRICIYLYVYICIYMWAYVYIVKNGERKEVISILTTSFE